MSRKFDLNELLDKSAVEIVVNGKSFFVRDIPLDLKDKATDDTSDMKTYVKRLLNCEDSDLEGLGLAAFSLIAKIIHENLLESQLSQS